MQPDLYCALEYCARALRMQSKGVTGLAIEKGTAIPPAMQQEIFAVVPSDIVHAGRTATMLSLSNALSAADLSEIVAVQYTWERENGLRSKGNAPTATMLPNAQTPAPWAGREAICAANTNPVERWLELDRYPTPFESQFSVYRRLMYQNVLGPSLAISMLGVRVGRTPGYLGRKVDLKLGNLAADLPSRFTDDLGLISDLPHLSGVLFDDRFRYCAACLGVHYHSVFHQLVAVEYCPLHETRILDVCGHCGQPVGSLEAVVTSVAGSYECRYCGEPLSHVDSSEDAVAIFRQALFEFEPQLRPWRDWFQTAQISLWPLEQIIAQDDEHIASWSVWCDVRPMLVEEAMRLHPVPGYAVEGDRPGTTLLTWDQRLRRPLTHGVRRRSFRKGITAVYALTVDRLRKDVATGNLASDAEALRFSGDITAAQRDLREIAMACMTVRAGENQSGFCGELLSAIQTSFAAAPAFQSDDAISRAQFRAYVLAAFGVFLAACSRDAATGGRLRSETFLALVPRKTTPLAYLPNAGNLARFLCYSAGVVLCPTNREFDPSCYGQGRGLGK
ncbi:hypothetical protein [Paraburkholderia caledonica]|uniref:hypothetical protein n=1 Tax=Paraburkholderia caledonica TaxID=134536 RepID=UPI001177C1B9|nr:hypothetical protein [Paraburkholderia caledonica]